MKAGKSNHFRLKGRELDEVLAYDAFVHIERMHGTGFWIGIYPKAGPPIMINTGVKLLWNRSGVERCVWFFNVDEDSVGGASFAVQRPRKPKAKVKKRA